jgi:hypothetical protein
VNILITCFSLLLVLALSSSMFWKEAMSSSFSLRAVKGVYVAEREARNILEKRQFSKLKKTESPAAPNKERKKGLRTSVFQSHRFENPPIEQGRFAILSIRGLEQQTMMKPIVQKLLFELYGHMKWYDQKLSMCILEKLAITSGDFDQKAFIQTLSEEEYALWYLMSKGTQTYDVSDKKGYPPLEDFLDFQTKPLKHTCHFPFASYPLLKAMFGGELTEEIIGIEKKKWQEDHRRRFCLKKELLALAKTKWQSAETLELIETYCFFQQSVGKRSHVQGEEKNSGIIVRKSCS